MSRRDSAPPVFTAFAFDVIEHGECVHSTGYEYESAEAARKAARVAMTDRPEPVWARVTSRESWSDGSPAFDEIVTPLDKSAPSSIMPS